MDYSPWVAKSQTGLSDFHFHHTQKKKKKTQYKLDAIVLSISLVLSKAYKTSLSIEKEFLSHKSIDTQG